MTRRNDRKSRRIQCGVCTGAADQDTEAWCAYGNGCFKVYCVAHGFSAGFTYSVHGCPCMVDRWPNFVDMAPKWPAAVKPGTRRRGRRHGRQQRVYKRSPSV